MCADISNNNVFIAPWRGFWYYLLSFVRCNVILFFSLLWLGFADINIYIKLILWCSSFILDRIALGKAEDVSIKTIDDFKLFAERSLAEGGSERRSRYAIYFILMLFLLWLIEILIHTSTILSNAAELYANIIVYEIVGVLYFYTVSAYLFDAKLINRRLKSTSARSSYMWVFIYTVFFAVTILFLHDIGSGENLDVHRLHGVGRSLNDVKYGEGFGLLVFTLTGYAALPMLFKVAAYAHYLGQKAKT